MYLDNKGQWCDYYYSLYSKYMSIFQSHNKISLTQRDSGLNVYVTKLPKVFANYTKTGPDNVDSPLLVLL